jgi:tetratricopeptide (TPR) repeat protein
MKKTIGNRLNIYIILFALPLLVYLKTVFFNFTYLDDNTLILDNNYFISNLSNIIKAFKSNVFLSSTDAYYRPVFTLSLMLDAQFNPLSPLYYHITNVVIHIINVCLVFGLLRTLGKDNTISLIFSCLFAVHPALSQAVAWIPGRNDSLMAMFTLLSFIFWLKNLKQPRPVYLGGHILFFALAIFTKESALALVPLIILYTLLIKDLARPKRLLAPLILWLSVITVFFHLRSLAFNNPLTMPIHKMLRVGISRSPELLIYAGKLFFPINLSVLPYLQNQTYLWGILTLAAAVLLLLLAERKQFNLIVFGIAWYLLFLLPSFINFNAKSYYLMEHRNYLPSIGLILVLIEMSPVTRLLSFSYAAPLLILPFIFLNLQHTENFRDRLVFWQNAVKTSPSCAFAHQNAGAMYYLDTRMDDAKKEFSKALELNPDEPMAHNNLGLIYAGKKMFPEAETEYLQEIKINPGYDNVYYNLGLLYYNEKRFEEAEKAWLKSVQINRNFMLPVQALAVYYFGRKDYKESYLYAKQLKEKGITIHPVLEDLIIRFEASSSR